MKKIATSLAAILTLSSLLSIAQPTTVFAAENSNTAQYQKGARLHIPQLKLAKNNFIADYKLADVNGDKIKDYVILAGEKENKQVPYSSNLLLLVQDGKSKKINKKYLGKNNGSYEPTIFLGDFNKDKIADILVSMPTGGSGGIIEYALLSWKGNKPQSLFDYEKFNAGTKMEVEFLPNFQAKLTINKKESTLDLVCEKDYYVEAGIYDNNGSLKENITGWLDPYSSLKPVDFDLDGNFELVGTQRICGICHADTIAHLFTTWQWDGKQMHLDQLQINQPLVSKRGDINGNGSIDTITIWGTRDFTSESTYTKDIKINLYDQKNISFEEFSIGKIDEGYAPQLFLGDVNQDGAADMLISIASGGSSGMVNYSLLSWQKNTLKPLINQETFSHGLNFQVVFKDNFKADVLVEDINKTYSLDIKEKKEPYIAYGIYNKKGKLIEQSGGMYNPITDLQAVDINQDGSYELLGTQPIRGTANAEILGYLHPIWRVTSTGLQLLDVKVSKD